MAGQNCANTIECLASEAKLGPHKVRLPSGCPIVYGISRLGDVCLRLEQTGWTPRRPTNATFKIVYSFENASQTALIFLRNNGVDIQILDKRGVYPTTRYSCVGFAPTTGPHVRHFLSQSGINLLEHALKFAEAFRHNQTDYSEFFRPIGSNKKVTAEMRRRFAIQDDDNGFNAMIHELFGGNGGDSYVGDGLSLSRSGRWSDDGR